MAKRKSTAAKVAPLAGLTCHELVQWLTANVGKERLRKEGHRTPMDAARWWIADLVANDMAEMSRREFAQTLLNPTPLRTAEDLTIYLSGTWDEEHSLEECLDAVSAQLAEFWGVK